MSSANVDIAVPIWDTSWPDQTTRNVRTQPVLYALDRSALAT
jgi:hypothetical protein